MEKRLFAVEEVGVRLPDLGQEGPVQGQLVQTTRIVPVYIKGVQLFLPDKLL